MPYQLGYATKIWMRRRESNSHQLVYKTSALKPIELRRNFGGPGGTQTLTRSLQDFYAFNYITSPGHLSLVIGHFSFAIDLVA